MQSLLKDLRTRIEAENHTPMEIYTGLKQMGLQMFFMKTLSRDMVITFCAGLIKLYSQLKEEQNVQS